MKKQVEETLDQYYGGVIPKIDQVSQLDIDEKLDIFTLRWREIETRKVITIKSLPAERGRIITKLV